MQKANLLFAVFILINSAVVSQSAAESREDLVLFSQIKKKSDLLKSQLNNPTSLVWEVFTNPRRLSETEIQGGAQSLERLSGGRLTAAEARRTLTERNNSDFARKSRYQVYFDSDISIADIFRTGSYTGQEYGVAWYRDISTSGLFITYDPNTRKLNFRSGPLDIAPIFTFGVPGDYLFNEGMNFLNDDQSSRVAITQSPEEVRIEVFPRANAREFGPPGHVIYPLTRKWLFSNDEYLEIREESLISNGVIVERTEFSEYQEVRPGLRYPTMIESSKRPLTLLTSDAKVEVFQMLPNESMQTSGTLYGLLQQYDGDLDAAFANLILTGWSVINSINSPELRHFPQTLSAAKQTNASLQDRLQDRARTTPGSVVNRQIIPAQEVSGFTTSTLGER